MTTAVRAAQPTRQAPERLVVWLIVGLAWAVIAVADATGVAGALHHHTLIEGGIAPPLAIALFAIGWFVMVAAMMVPASSLAIARHSAVRGFLASYLAAWTIFGLVCFVGDAAIHGLVDTTPWLAANAWLIPALSLAGAGLYQFVPAKRRFIEACRTSTAGHADHGAIRAGAAHALDCIGASGPLMLLMFAAGFASLAWMVTLALLMSYEVRGHHSTAAIRASGAVLIWLAVLATMGGVPGWVTPG
jgi:predicted metal-binding membrane protein